MPYVNIPLKHDEMQGGKAKSYKSAGNDQGTGRIRRKATDKEKQMQAERMVPMVKGLLTGMKVTKMRASLWYARYK